MQRHQGNELEKFALAKSISEIAPNLFFFGIGVIVIVLLAKYVWWWLGFAGFVAYCILLLIDLVRMLIVVGSGFALLFAKELSAKAQVLSWGTTLVQLFETVVFVVYTGIIYRYLF